LGIGLARDESDEVRSGCVIPDGRIRAAKTAPVEVTGAVYAELRALAHRSLRGNGVGNRGLLRTTALVNEAWLKLRGYDPSIWDGRREYAALAAAAMRSVLVDEARARGQEQTRERVATRAAWRDGRGGR
jgi:hypothetical protein